MHNETQVSPELSALERAVLEIVLAPDIGVNARLREQMEVARVSLRTPSGVGFMTKLDVPGALAVPDAPEDATLPTVYGVHPELPAGAEFILQVRAGRLNTIEAFCFQGMWPGDESRFRLEVRP